MILTLGPIELNETFFPSSSKVPFERRSVPFRTEILSVYLRHNYLDC